MFRHRLAPEADHYRLPEPPPPPIRPESFALCSMAVIPGCCSVQWACHQQLYAWAFEIARETVRPSPFERDPFSFWN